MAELVDAAHSEGETMVVQADVRPFAGSSPARATTNKEEPMKQKYIESAVRPWFVFGTYKKSGFVDISDGEHDVWGYVPPDSAEELIQARNRHIKEITEIITRGQAELSRHRKDTDSQSSYFYAQQDPS